MMCRTKSTDFISLGLLGVAGDRGGIGLARRSRRPGRTMLPTIRPSTSAKVETISK